MIESIQLSNVATYDITPQLMNPLSTINFIFGSNGSGKTTISRVIADEAKFPSCKVRWKGQARLQPLVYNLDFVEKNYNQSMELKGIFTLGEQNIDTLNKIAAAKEEVDSHNRKIDSLVLSLQGEDEEGGKKGDLAELEEKLKNQCWAQKQKHDGALFGAFEGYRGNSEKFKTKVLAEKEYNKSDITSAEDLYKRAEMLFGTSPTMQSKITSLDFGILISSEENPILGKKIIGKEDVDIAAMIQKLGNSDWVKQGREYYELNEGVCPFCQQTTTESFSKSLNDYFDETFTLDITALKELEDSYVEDSVRITKQMAAIVESAPEKLDLKKFKTEQELLGSAIRINTQKIGNKRKEPSRTIELESLNGIKKQIELLVEMANSLIENHNKMVTNFSEERRKLIGDVWKFLVEVELKVDLADYDRQKKDLNKAIQTIETKIQSEIEARDRKLLEIRQFEKETTSIQPTIDEINSMLSAFGFRGFSISKAPNGISYKLIRASGEDAKETLSEGERSFVTFLYFYHLIKGSDSDSGMTMDRVVVFDDPVSSLDSDVLFIVVSFIKELFDEVREGKGYVKQVFVMTHNIYFHREVTFNPRRSNDKAMKEETFWIVRKIESTSKLQIYSSNPIKTSYEFLWAEIRDPNRSNLSIQNILRRILENYFRILGGIDPDRLCAMFTGQERLICKSLFSWVNAGSHFAHDDLYITADDTMTEMYLRVFKDIFDKSDQIAHYNMMMGEGSQKVSSG